MAVRKKTRTPAKKASHKGEQQTAKISGRIVHVLPDNVPVIFSDGMIVTHTQNEFVLSFLQTRHPLAHKPEDVKTVNEIESRCIVRIVITPGQMKEFVDALVRNFESFVAKIMKAGEEDAGDS